MSIDKAKQDLKVKVVGKVKPQENMLIAPLSRRKCVLYQVTVHEVYKTDLDYFMKDESESETLREENLIDFYFEDQAGLAKVTRLSQDVLLVNQQIYKSREFDNLPQHFIEYLRSHDEDHRDVFRLKKNLIFRESSIGIGESISVTGKGYWHRPRQGEPVFVMRGDFDEPLLISDQFSA
ncbi:MAG: hypothetical protein AAFX87_23590 [Bacteroidota bacterium]